MGKDSFALVTGLFMTVLIASTVMLIYWLSDVQHRTKTYVAQTHQSVTGLKSGSTVYYRGIEAGKVISIGFDSDNSDVILVVMEIDEDIVFTRGVFATLQMKGVTGLTQIALQDNGSNPAHLIPGHNAENRIPLKPSLIERLSDSGEETVKQARELMGRLNDLLNDNNRQHIEQILVNVDTATYKLNQLESSAEKILDQVPVLTADVHQSLVKMNHLADEFTLLSQQLRQDMTVLSNQSTKLMQTENIMGQQLLNNTLPRAETLIMQLQAMTRKFDRVGSMLETDPQMFLFGTELLKPAPGEPGFKEAQ